MAHDRYALDRHLPCLVVPANPRHLTTTSSVCGKLVKPQHSRLLFCPGGIGGQGGGGGVQGEGGGGGSGEGPTLNYNINTDRFTMNNRYVASVYPSLLPCSTTVVVCRFTTTGKLEYIFCIVQWPWRHCMTPRRAFLSQDAIPKHAPNYSTACITGRLANTLPTPSGGSMVLLGPGSLPSCRPYVSDCRMRGDSVEASSSSGAT
jgi:hypothetical protein